MKQSLPWGEQKPAGFEQGFEREEAYEPTKRVRLRNIFGTRVSHKLPQAWFRGQIVEDLVKAPFPQGKVGIMDK